MVGQGPGRPPMSHAAITMRRLMTTTSTVATAAHGAPEQTGLVDADGHVLEDVPAIVSKLPDKWREGRERLLRSDLSRLHGMSIFPPLGYLSTIPTAGRSQLGRGPKETGRDSASWEYFLGEVGIERTVLYP